MGETKQQYIPNRALGEAWGSLPCSFTEYKKSFVISSNLSVASKYAEARTHFYNLAYSNQFAALTKELNFTQRVNKKGKNISGTSAKLDKQIETWINQIKNAKITEFRFKIKDGSTEINRSIAQNLYNKWQDVLSLMKNQQWSNLNTELQILTSYSEQLKNMLDNSNSGDLIDLKNILGEGDAYSLASRLEGLLSRIQGEVLEQEVKKFLMRKIPNRVAVTGSITLSTGGKIKPDLIATMLDCLELQNEEGQATYVFKNGVIHDADGNPATGTVTLTDYELKQLIDNSLGFSAKTTAGRPTFHQGYNINQLIKDALQEEDSSAIWQLMHFYQLGLQDVPNLDAYQRYAVSRLATQILGENNAYIITNNEIIPTYEYVEKIMNRGLSFVNKKIPARAGNFVLNDQFGSTNIVGPKV